MDKSIVLYPYNCILLSTKGTNKLKGTTLMNLRHSIVSGIQKSTYCMIPFYGISENVNSSLLVESRLEVAWSWEWRGEFTVKGQERVDADMHFDCGSCYIEEYICQSALNCTLSMNPVKTLPALLIAVAATLTMRAFYCTYIIS